METTIVDKKVNAALKKRQAVICKLRTAGAIADALRELRKSRGLTESERGELALAEQDESICRSQLEYRNGRSWLPVPWKMEYADKLPENPEEVEIRYTKANPEPGVRRNVNSARSTKEIL